MKKVIIGTSTLKEETYKMLFESKEPDKKINNYLTNSDPHLTLRDKTRDIYDIHEYGEPSKEEKRRFRAMEEIHTHLSNNRRTWRDEYELVKSRKSKLSRYCRDIIVKYFENRSDE